MPVSPGFTSFVLEQLDRLDRLGPITPRRMFGGVGLYAGDLFFAILMRDVLYLKADAATRSAREAAGGLPFQPFPDRSRGKVVTQYYSVPVSILEDSDQLIAWAKAAVAIAAAARLKGSRS